MESGDLQHIKECLTAFGVDVQKLFYYLQGDGMEIGLVLGSDGQIYHFEYSYDDEPPDEEVQEKFDLQKVSMTELSKDKKIYLRALIALQMGGVRY